MCGADESGPRIRGFRKVPTMVPPVSVVGAETLVRRPRPAEALLLRTARAPWWALPLALFLVTRVVEGVLLMIMARHQLPEPADYGRPVPIVQDPASYSHVIANWDGQQYRVIAEHGYPGTLPRHEGQVEQNPWAFYPLYPALVRLVMLTHLSFGWAATVVSVACGAVAMCLLFALLERSQGRFGASLTVLALCTYASAVTFQAAYTESLALLLVVLALTALQRRRYAALVGCAFALSLTRPIVPALALAVVLYGVWRWRRRDVDPFPPREALRVAASAGLMGVFFLLWPAVAGVVTGERNAYLETQRAWVLDGSDGWPSWLAMLFAGHRIGAVDLALLVLLVTLIWVYVLARRPAALWGPELRTWALAYPAYLMVATRPTTSIFRYAMLAAVLWWPVPEVALHRFPRAGRVALAATIAALGLASQVVWLRWFFVLTPAAISPP